MFESCLEKQQKVKALFALAETKEARYEKIIELGSLLSSFPLEEKTHENRVRGCQSQMFLHSHLHEGKVLFQADADALISRGLAFLLLSVYSDELPETILKCPPTYLEELGIPGSLSPTRAGGLYSLHLKMKQEALRLLMGNEK